MVIKSLTTVSRITMAIYVFVAATLIAEIAAVIFFSPGLSLVWFVVGSWIVLGGFVVLRDIYFAKFDTFAAFRIDWGKKWVYIFDIDGTITSSIGVVLPAVRDSLIALVKCGSVIIFNTGNTMENALKNIDFLKVYLTGPGQVYVSVEYGLNIIDLFTGEAIDDKNFENILTDSRIKEILSVPFVKQCDLVPYDSQTIGPEDKIVCDGKKQQYILKKDVIPQIKYPIGYVSVQKSKMITVELFKDQNGKVLDWCLNEQNSAVADCNKLISQNGLQDKISVTKSGTAIDFLPRVNGVAYDKGYSTGFLLQLVAKAHELDVKTLAISCVAFGDGFADFAMHTPILANGKKLNLDMAYVGGMRNFKYGRQWWKVGSVSGEVINENPVVGYEKNGELLILVLTSAILWRQHT